MVVAKTARELYVPCAEGRVGVAHSGPWVIKRRNCHVAELMSGAATVTGDVFISQARGSMCL